MAQTAPLTSDLNVKNHYLNIVVSLLLIACSRPHYIALQPSEFVPDVRPDFIVPLQGSSPVPSPVIPVVTTTTTSDSCDTVDQKEFGWLMASAAAGVLGGVGGLSTIPVQTTVGKDAIAGVSLGIGVFSAIAAVAVSYYSSKFKTMSCVPAPATSKPATKFVVKPAQ